jgi:hypothetical protein
MTRPDRLLVSELEFGQEMEIWNDKGTYPLEAISLVVGKDKKGQFYYPAIDQYVGGPELVIERKLGYRSREKALECVGRCWDKALAKSDTL